MCRCCAGLSRWSARWEEANSWLEIDLATVGRIEVGPIPFMQTPGRERSIGCEAFLRWQLALGTCRFALRWLVDASTRKLRIIP